MSVEDEAVREKGPEIFQEWRSRMPVNAGKTVSVHRLVAISYYPVAHERYRNSINPQRPATAGNSFMHVFDGRTIPQCIPQA